MTTAEFLNRRAEAERRDMTAMAIYAAFVSVAAVAVLVVAWGLSDGRSHSPPISFAQPIVSVSLGLPAVFQWGGQTRHDPLRKLTLAHGLS